MVHCFFFSTHGCGVTRGHTSATCFQCCDAHVETATCFNPGRPGTALNKGWDKGLWRHGTVLVNSKTKDLSTNNTAVATPTKTSPTPPPLPTSATASIIADTRASGFYLVKGSPCSAIKPKAPKILFDTATGQTQASYASCHLNMDLPVTDAHIITGFQHSLLGIGKLCDEDCTVLSKKHSVQLFNPDSDIILTGWRDTSGPRHWRFSLLPKNTDAPPATPITTATTADASST